MKRKLIANVLALLVIVLGPSLVRADNLEEYLILNDIGSYKRLVKTWDLSGNEKAIPGYWISKGPGVLIYVKHFWDHVDYTYETVYEHESTDGYAEVQVTQHAGGESDRWLLHELEGTQRFSSDDQGLLGMLEWGTVLIKVNGQRVMFVDGKFKWLSGNKVISVTYEAGETEPEEVFQAYLAKHPSTITMTDSEMKSVAHTQKWIMDEIERRLWLNDKGLEAYANGKTEKSDLFDSLHKNSELFLRYTNKYLGRSMKSDLEEVDNYGYLTKDLEGLKKKHAEFKAWWAMHKLDTPDVPTFEEVERRQE